MKTNCKHFSGAIFDKKSDDLVAAFEKAIDLQNVMNIHVQFNKTIIRISSEDTLEAEQAACDLLSEGVIAIIGPDESIASGY